MLFLKAFFGEYPSDGLGFQHSIEFLLIRAPIAIGVGSSPRGGATKEKTSQKCEVFFDFTCHRFVKKFIFYANQSCFDKKIAFFIQIQNISFQSFTI
jgi:hypothetical protein